MNTLLRIRRLLFPSFLGLVITATFFSFSPYQLVTTVLSQTREQNDEVVSPKATHNVASEEESVNEKKENVSQEKKVLSQEEKKNISPSEDNSENTKRDSSEISKSRPTAKVTVDSNGIVTAKSTIVSSGRTIHLIMKYPKKGGTVSGTIDGDCDGTVTGTYISSGEGSMKGTAKAKCPAGFVPIPVTISYNSAFTPDDEEATIYYTTKALGTTQQGSTTLLLTS